MSTNKAIIIKRVKKHGGGGHHGGAWKVAYADFVTAMMAFFLLMWLLNMTSDEKRVRLSQYFKHFSIYDKGGTSFMGKSSEIFGESGESKQKVFTDKHRKESENAENMELLLYKLGDEIDKNLSRNLGDLKDQVSLDITEEGLRIQMFDKEGSLMFEKGSTTLTPRAKEILKRISGNINENKHNVLIDGHTDATPFKGKEYSNWELSSGRASAARRELEKNGFDPARVGRVAGYADSDLLIKDNPADPRNRRITFTLQMPRKEIDPRELTGDIRQMHDATEEFKRIVEDLPVQTPPAGEEIKDEKASEGAGRPLFNIFKWNPFRPVKREAAPDAKDSSSAARNKEYYDTIIKEGQFNEANGHSSASSVVKAKKEKLSARDKIKKKSGPSMIQELSSGPIAPIFNQEEMFTAPEAEAK